MIRTKIKAGEMGHNHNEKAVAVKSRHLTIKTGIKSGERHQQHNEKISLAVRTGIKAGGDPHGQHNEKLMSESNNGTIERGTRFIKKLSLK